MEYSYTCAGCGKVRTVVEEYPGQALHAAQDEWEEGHPGEQEPDEMYCGDCYVARVVSEMSR